METNIYRFLECSDDGRTILKCDTNFTGDLILPEGIERIADFAFEGCFRLKNITIPHGITSIGDRAFGCCSSLKEITIPQTVKTLGDGVFDGCCELKSICFMGIVDHIGETYQWLEDGTYSDEDDEYFYGVEMNLHSFEEEEEVWLEWLERKNRLHIHVPQGCEWHYFKQLNKEFSPVSGLPSRPEFYNILSIKDENPTYEMYKEKTTEEYIQSESAMAHKVPLITFCQTYGAPKVREYKTLGFTALLCKDEDGEETFISPPKSGNALTLVDFSKSPAEIAAALARNAENLVVLQSYKESDGSPCYTLIDKENYATNGFIKPDYYEEGTSYARQVNKLCSHSFSDIRDISVKFIQEFDDEEIDELFEEINHGMNVLSTNEHLHIYMYCFGLMHEAKLNKAFLEIPKRFFKPSEIEIVDYACGQGIASLCFANFLEDSGHETRIKKITLIEPSTVALSRAALICHKVCPEAIIETIASEFDDLEDDQISTAEVPRVHLLSNILDMTCYDLNHLARVINQVKKKGDLFVCVDPWYHDRKLDGRQRKLMRLSNGKEIYHDVFNAYQLQEDKSWTAYITIFRV